MGRLWIKGVMVSAAVSTLAACGSVDGEAVHERVTSPDGKMEAVLMTCSMAGDAKAKLITGAVFEGKGGSCDGLADKALTSVRVSMPLGEESAKASVKWENGQAVFSFEGDRTVISREAKAGARLDLIAVRGDFEEADIIEAP